MLKERRRDSSQTIFVKRSLVMGSDVNDSSRGCTRLLVELSRSVEGSLVSKSKI
jgi:hypothetical protein